MSEQIPVVKIKCPENQRTGYALINEADFDPDKHQLFDVPVPDDGGNEEDEATAALSDDFLRTEIEKATGEKPHHFTGRKKLVEMYLAVEPQPSNE